MKMVSGNAALLQALDTKRSVRLFYKLERTGSRWKYVGDYLVTEVVDGISEDDNGNLRSDYRFVFEGISELTQTTYGLPSPEPKEPRSYPEDELWALVEKARETTGGRRTRGDLMHPQKRLANPAISAYARQRAIQFGGTCELCEYDPGWRTSKGAIHLQVHHLHPDIDLVDWVAAVCGTCHDRLHHSTDRHESTKKLRERIVERQTSRGRPIVDGRDILLPKT
ncbi:MAG: hypothetical protein M3Y23_05370, partial [Actinomycetota bacterium]|nr:hypothetical protein [Actinomycetota bacterium]